MKAGKNGNTYLRLLRYLAPYWRKVILLFVCTTIFASLSGVSLTLIPPFLHILFGERTESSVEEGNGGDGGVPLPDLVNDIKDGVVGSARSFIYEGTPEDRLMRFCVIFFLQR